MEPAAGAAGGPGDLVLPPARGDQGSGRARRRRGQPVAGCRHAARRASSLLDEVARNLVLDTAPATAAARVYTGVLYDALDLPSLDAAARRRANRWLVVVSALHGAVRPGDRITAYRLSMGVDLPGVGRLAATWRPGLDQVLPGAAGRGVVVDCRSAAYAAAWRPREALASRWVQVRVPGASRQAKHVWGLVARRLCVAGVSPRSVPALAEVVAEDFSAAHQPTGPGGRGCSTSHRRTTDLAGHRRHRARMRPAPPRAVTDEPRPQERHAAGPPAPPKPGPLLPTRGLASCRRARSASVPRADGTRPWRSPRSSAQASRCSCG